MRGILELGSDSLEKIGKALQSSESELQNIQKFRDLYSFTYNCKRIGFLRRLIIEHVPLSLTSYDFQMRSTLRRKKISISR